MVTVMIPLKCRILPGDLGEVIADRRDLHDETVGQLVIHVIYTSPRRTLDALNVAIRLATGLEATIHLLYAQQVPLAFPIDRPPVDVNFTKSLLLDLAHRAAQRGIEVQVQIYLCRDKFQAVLEVLRPHSLIVVGGKDHWWPRADQRMIRILAEKGHHIVLASSE